MSVLTIIIECLILAIPFSIMVTVLLNKDPVNMITDYPPEIQAEYYRSQGLEAKKEKLTAKNYIAKAIFMVVALAVVVGFAYLAGARSFLDGFIAAICYCLALFAFDTFIIDWIFFPRVILNTNKKREKSAPKSYICEIVGLIFSIFYTNSKPFYRQRRQIE